MNVIPLIDSTNNSVKKKYFRLSLNLIVCTLQTLLFIIKYEYSYNAFRSNTANLAYGHGAQFVRTERFVESLSASPLVNSILKGRFDMAI